LKKVKEARKDWRITADPTVVKPKDGVEVMSLYNPKENK
jgi:hypothetical protein